jgi:hypothetical protein
VLAAPFDGLLGGLLQYQRQWQRADASQGLVVQPDVELGVVHDGQQPDVCGVAQLATYLLSEEEEQPHCAWQLGLAAQPHLVRALWHRPAAAGKSHPWTRAVCAAP